MVQDEAAFAALRAVLARLPVPPTHLVRSGGGYQALWRFSRDLDPAEHLARVEAVGRELASALGSDAVQNVNRWLRLPGSVNWPNAKKRDRGRVPAAAVVELAAWDRAWDLDGPSLVPGDGAPDDGGDNDPEAPDALRGFPDLPQRWQKLVRSGDAQGYDDDRSRLVYSFIVYLLKKRWGDAEIRQFLVNPLYGISEHCRKEADPAAAAQRQIERARQRTTAASWDYDPRGRVDPASFKNVIRAVGEIGVELSYNEMSYRCYANGWCPAAPLDDGLIGALRIEIQQRWSFLVSREVLNDTLLHLGKRRPTHPVREYLARVEAVPGDPEVDDALLDGWLARATGCTDDAYHRAVGRLFLVGAARRARRPGAKFDEMLVLVSPGQGTGKSTLLRELCADHAWFSDAFPLNSNDRQVIEQTSGKWIVECGELHGFTLTDVNRLKGLLSRQSDYARLSYAHYATDVPRQVVFAGTCNDLTFLRDRENRRFWPVRVRTTDVDWLSAHRDRLWGAAARAEARWPGDVRLPRDLWAVAQHEQERYRVGDAWVDVLEPYLRGVSGRLPSAEVYTILGLDTSRMGPVEQKRLSEVMGELGWERHNLRFNGVVTRCFIKGDTEAERAVAVYVHRDPVDRDHVTVTSDPVPSYDSPAGLHPLDDDADGETTLWPRRPAAALT